ncbi:unnamed protein product [Phytophthora lilii]|uniref:Histone H4 n=1 Tax=Phytophthora lilii TaxID=2077276 RepID=A0A9W6UE89_9STRA|nr:unnamed protein product [Phytophthora lilii]
MSGRGQGAEGLGQGAKRHRKILRDCIQGVSKPAIRRLARRAGVVRISGLIYHETRAVLRVYLTNLIRDAVTYAEHANRKTVACMDVVYALKRQGQILYGFDAGPIGSIKATEPSSGGKQSVAAIAQVETASLTSRGSAKFSDGCDDLFSRAAEGVHHDLAVAVQPLQPSEFSSASLTVLSPGSSPPQMHAPTPGAYPGRLASRIEDQLAILRDMLDIDTDEHDCEPAGNSADTIPSRQPGSRRRYLAVVLRSALTERAARRAARAADAGHEVAAPNPDIIPAEQHPAEHRLLTSPQCIANSSSLVTTTTTKGSRSASNTKCGGRPVAPTIPRRTFQHEATKTQENVKRGIEEVYTDAELNAMQTKRAFVIPTVGSLQEIKSVAVEKMASASLEMKPYCICELDCPSSEICTRELDNAYIEVRTHH